MIVDLVKYENFLSQKKVAKELFETAIEDLQTKIKIHKESLVDHIEALDIMNVVGILVQQEFEEVVEVLVTQALKFVFGDNHSFEIDSKIAHNQPEIHLFIVIDGEKFSPEDDEFSGGQADVISFALRVILWAIQYERTRAALVFDEPFRNLHGTEHAKSIREMTQYLSKMLNLQFIIVTQDKELTRMADTAFLVVKDRGVSKVELMEKLEMVDA